MINVFTLQKILVCKLKKYFLVVLCIFASGQPSFSIDVFSYSKQAFNICRLSSSWALSPSPAWLPASAAWCQTCLPWGQQYICRLCFWDNLSYSQPCLLTLKKTEFVISLKISDFQSWPVQPGHEALAEWISTGGLI